MSNHEELQGRGTLFFADERLWGEVDYRISVRGQIKGTLRAVADSSRPNRFFDIAILQRPGALKLDDGRWLHCTIQPNGRFSGASDIKPPGPQPKP